MAQIYNDFMYSALKSSGIHKPVMYNTIRAVNRLSNNRLINRLLLRVIDNRAMHATTNYTIGSHDNRIFNNFGHKECTKVRKEAVYYLLRDFLPLTSYVKQ